MDNNKIAFIIGNGPSRLAIDPEKLMEYGTVYGCNAIYRDFTPHFLVAVDRKVQEEIVNSGYLDPCIFRQTRDQKIGTTNNIEYFKKVICQPANSGVVALYYAMKAKHTHFYLIGFDFKNPKNPKDCNVYTGTPGYEVHAKKPPKVRMGIIDKIEEWAVRNCGTCTFTRVIDHETCWVPDTPGYKEPNMKHITYDEFKEVKWVK